MILAIISSLGASIRGLWLAYVKFFWAEPKRLSVPLSWPPSFLRVTLLATAPEKTELT